MTIDMSNWLKKYKSRTAVASGDLVAGFEKATGIVDKMLSPDAIQAFKTKVTSDLAMKKREVNLRAIGDAGLKANMRAKGAGNYITGTGLAAQKAADHFRPIAAAIDAGIGTLPARTSDPVANATARVPAMVKIIVDAAKARVGAT